MKAENPNLEIGTHKKKSSIPFISIIHHIAWNQGCRVTIFDLSHGCDEDKGSAWSHHGGATQWGNVSFYYVLSGNLPLRFAVWKACVEVVILEGWG